MQRNYLFLVLLFALFSFGAGFGVFQEANAFCTEDIWTCTDWSACTEEGVAMRNCTLTTDCPLTDTSEPTTVRSCTPALSETSLSVPTTSTTAIASSTLEQRCTTDIWECSSWGQCSEEGIATRTCMLTTDCELDTSTPPEQTQTCARLTCDTLTGFQQQYCKLEQLQWQPAPFQHCNESDPLCAYGKLVDTTCFGNSELEHLNCADQLTESLSLKARYRIVRLTERTKELYTQGVNINDATQALTAFSYADKQIANAPEDKTVMYETLMMVRRSWQAFTLTASDQLMNK